MLAGGGRLRDGWSCEEAELLCTDCSKVSRPSSQLICLSPRYKFWKEKQVSKFSSQLMFAGLFFEDPSDQKG